MQADGELEDGVEAEAVCEAEEVAAFAADGGVDLLIGGIAGGEPDWVLASEVAFVAGAELAAAHVVDAKVDGVVEWVVGGDCFSVADADVGLQFVPAVFAGDFACGVISQLEVEATHLDVAVLAQAAGEAGTVSHGAFAEGEPGGEVEVAAEGVDIDEEASVVAVEVEAGALVAPGFGAAVAKGGAAQAHADVGIESVADAYAQPLGTTGGGDGEVRGCSVAVLFFKISDLLFSCVEGLCGAEQGKEEEDEPRFMHGVSKTEMNCPAL